MQSLADGTGGQWFSLTQDPTDLQEAIKTAIADYCGVRIEVSSMGEECVEDQREVCYEITPVIGDGPYSFGVN